MAADAPLYLIFSGTSTTGAAAVQALSEAGARVRAATRDPDSDKAKAAAALPGVEVVKGDLNDADSVKAALVGVKRAYVVSGAGEDTQYDRESNFIAAATAAGVDVVRCSTATSLIALDSEGVYARAHARVEKYIADNKSRVVDLNPDWFMHNLLGSAGEAKATGKISWPVDAEKSVMSAYVDPRDVGTAAAAILLANEAKFAEFLALGRVEVHGPEPVNFAIQAREISAANGGKPLEFQKVDGAAWSSALQGFGLSKHFADSFLATVQIMGGEKEGPRPHTNENSPLLLTVWKPTRTLSAWAKEFGAAFFA